MSWLSRAACLHVSDSTKYGNDMLDGGPGAGAFANAAGPIAAARLDGPSDLDLISLQQPGFRRESGLRARSKSC